jgi:hypothetical protein
LSTRSQSLFNLIGRRKLYVGSGRLQFSYGGLPANDRVAHNSLYFDKLRALLHKYYQERFRWLSIDDVREEQFEHCERGYEAAAVGRVCRNCAYALMLVRVIATVVHDLLTNLGDDSIGAKTKRSIWVNFRRKSVRLAPLLSNSASTPPQSWSRSRNSCRRKRRRASHRSEKEPHRACTAVAVRRIPCPSENDDSVCNCESYSIYHFIRGLMRTMRGIADKMPKCARSESINEDIHCLGRLGKSLLVGDSTTRTGRNIRRASSFRNSFCVRSITFPASCNL